GSIGALRVSTEGRVARTEPANCSGCTLGTSGVKRLALREELRLHAIDRNRPDRCSTHHQRELPCHPITVILYTSITGAVASLINRAADDLSTSTSTRTGLAERQTRR